MAAGFDPVPRIKADPLAELCFVSVLVLAVCNTGLICMCNVCQLDEQRRLVHLHVTDVIDIPYEGWLSAPQL